MYNELNSVPTSNVNVPSLIEVEAEQQDESFLVNPMVSEAEDIDTPLHSKFVKTPSLTL
jgi:hypothetical protein